MLLKPKSPLYINVQCPHTLAHHINPTTKMKDVAFNAMYKRLGLSAPSATELVCTEGINILRLLGVLNVDRVKYIVKAICRPGRSAIGNDVSKTSEDHLIVACHICKYWRCTSRESKTCAKLVTTGDLFEEAERQIDLERIWDKNQEICHAFTNDEFNKNFNAIYKEFEDPCSSFCECSNNPILYLMRKNLIPKDEINNTEKDYVAL